MATESGLYNTINTIHKGYYSKQITRNFKTISLLPAAYILTQKAVLLNTCLTVRKYLA